MRQPILTLGLILATQPLLAQEALTLDSPATGHPGAVDIATPTTGNAWIDLRQNAKPGVVQNVPKWVEAVTFIPADTQTNPAALSVFRIRLARPDRHSTILFFRIFFNDQTSAHPEIVAWDESGSQVLRSGPLGVGTELASSDAVMIPMHGATTIEAFAEYDRLLQTRGLVAVHPFDDPLVLAGQGTVGLEILEDVPDVDAVVVPVGGGGLISGIATALKEQQPRVRVVGVEPEGAPSLTRALEAGRVVPLPTVQTMADGLAAPFAGPLTLDIALRYVDDVVLVSEDEIAEALRLTLERTKLQVEPAGAAGVAALLTRRCGVRPGARVVAVLSGGNVDRALLKELL